MTPTPSQLKTPDIVNMSQTKLAELRAEKELAERNRPYTDEELDMLLPGMDDGFEIVKVPETYKPEKNINSLLNPSADNQSYQMPESMSKPIA